MVHSGKKSHFRFNFIVSDEPKMPMRRDASPNITVDKAELRERLTPVEYQVTQEKMTER